MEAVIPIEQSDPEFAELLHAVCHNHVPAAVFNRRVFHVTQSYKRRWPRMLRPPYSFEIVREIILDVGRNDPCICGSGRKFKKCCGRGAL